MGQIGNNNDAGGQRGGSVAHQAQKNSRNAVQRVQTANNNNGSRHGNKITNQYF